MRKLRIAAATAVLLATGVAGGTTASAQTAYSASVKLQQVIAGGQTVSPTGPSGYPRLSVGYAYQIPSLASGGSATVTVNSPAFQFDWKCIGLSLTGQWHVNVPNSTRTVTTTAWWPSSDPKASVTRMNTVAVPNSCAGSNISIKSHEFVNSFTSTAPNPLSFRWHYVYCTSATSCTSGAWTTTFAVTPVSGGVYPPPAVAGLHLVRPVVKPVKKLAFTGAEIGGMVAGAVILVGGGTALLIAGRRRRRERVS
jgi:hypothetical protein